MNDVNASDLQFYTLDLFTGQTTAFLVYYTPSSFAEVGNSVISSLPV